MRALLLAILSLAACDDGEGPNAAPLPWGEGALECPEGTVPRSLTEGGEDGATSVWCEDEKSECHGPWAGFVGGELQALGEHDHGKVVAQTAWLPNGWVTHSEGTPDDIRRALVWDKDGRVLLYQSGHPGKSGSILLTFKETSGELESAVRWRNGRKEDAHDVAAPTFLDELRAERPSKPPHLEKQPPLGPKAERLCTYKEPPPRPPRPQMPESQSPPPAQVYQPDFGGMDSFGE